MAKIKTFSLSRHSQLFSVPDNNEEYLFVKAGDSPYQEEPYRAESYAIVFIKEGGVKLNVGLVSWEVEAPSIITLGPSVVRYFTRSNDLLKMDVIFFKEKFLLEQHADLFFLFKYDFFENSDLLVFPLKESYITKFSRIFELIELTQATTMHHKAQIIRNYIFALV